MVIIFEDGSEIVITLDNSELSSVYKKIYKHLQHVTVPFKDWDNPFYNNSQSVDSLINCASLLGITLDRKKLVEKDQQYFNSIHKIYEKNYDGNPLWLDFHEHIHMCEAANDDKVNHIQIHYREKAGLLKKKFDPLWFNRSDIIKKGEVFVWWSELGKIPYHYYKDGEPDNLLRLCELAKPWLALDPIIMIAVEDIVLPKADNDIESFNEWWSLYHDDWCKHWNISSWSLTQMFSACVFGNILEIDKCIKLLQNNIHPARVKL